MTASDDQKTSLQQRVWNLVRDSQALADETQDSGLIRAAFSIESAYRKAYRGETPPTASEPKDSA